MITIPTPLLYLFPVTALLISIVYALHFPDLPTEHFVKAFLFFGTVATLKTLVLFALIATKCEGVILLIGIAISAAVATQITTGMLTAVTERTPLPMPLLPITIAEGLMSPWLVYWSHLAEHRGAHYVKSNVELKTKYYKALTHQIHHHFLFNTLNTTVYLISDYPKRATVNLENLALLYRELLNQKDTNTAQQEIKIMKAYINIEKNRLGKRCRVRYHCPPDLLNLRLPTMTLQPLVENAIYYGVEPSENGACIDVSVQTKDSHRATLTVRNPYYQQQTQSGSRLTHSNLEQRMGAFYGEAGFQFLRYVQEGFYCARIVLPRTKVSVNNESTNS